MNIEERKNRKGGKRVKKVEFVKEHTNEKKEKFNKI
jgi:hypothetical protein